MKAIFYSPDSSGKMLETEGETSRKNHLKETVIPLISEDFDYKYRLN